ncbi:MAG: glycerol kinase [Candidatus Hydrogenedentota bacterium]
MSKRLILALDQGTASSRSIVFDDEGKIRASVNKEFAQIYPLPGWVEHDPEEIWSSQLETAKAALKKAGATASDVAAIGITNQRETTVIWDRTTGKPIYNAIVWQCRRTAPICEQISAEGLTAEFSDRTGLVMDAYFSGTKVKWILDHVPGARKRAQRGELCFGTIDSWLLFNLTGKHATDCSNASRTLLYNIHTLQWDDVLLKALQVPHEILPEVGESSTVYGVTHALGGGIPVAALCGDQQSALFGQAGFDEGECKNTYGTGCFLLMNTGKIAVSSKHGLLTTIAWGIGGNTTYALEGSVFIGGAVIQWLRDELGLIATAAESEAVASQVENTGGVYVVPAFVGLGAPHWNMNARGVIAGLTRGSSRAHMVRAALESISFQSADVARCMEKDLGHTIPKLKVDGGACTNNLLMQHQADILGCPVHRGVTIESTAQGAAFLAGLAVGVWQSQDVLRSVWKPDRVFEPIWNNEQREKAVNGWQNAVKKTLLEAT